MFKSHGPLIGNTNMKTTMEPRCVLHLRWGVAAGMAMLLAGCAHFESQTSDAEPHGLVEIVKSLNYAGDVDVVKKLDGMPVRGGQTYRVKPGEHTVVVKLVETVSETMGSPVGMWTPQPVMYDTASQRSTATGLQSISTREGGGVYLSGTRRRITYATNSISVQPGWRYALEGGRVVKTPF
jgi:hypothetical protein